jgi:hypothetical protein
LIEVDVPAPSTAQLNVSEGSKISEILTATGYQVLSYDQTVTRFHMPSKFGETLLDVYFVIHAQMPKKTIDQYIILRFQ